MSRALLHREPSVDSMSVPLVERVVRVHVLNLEDLLPLVALVALAALLVVLVGRPQVLALRRGEGGGGGWATLRQVCRAAARGTARAGCAEG